jgi:hypothetical protein
MISIAKPYETISSLFFFRWPPGDPWFAAVLFAMAFAFIATFDLILGDDVRGGQSTIITGDLT